MRIAGYPAQKHPKGGQKVTRRVFRTIKRYYLTMIQKQPMFIAEISGNHMGSLDRAKELVQLAANAGASAVKLQTYTAETMTLDIDSFSVSEDHPLWGGRRLFELYEEAHTPWEWHKELFDLCKELKVVPFSTPFDLTAFEFLESLNTPMYKIASLETSDHELIAEVAKTLKPVIISTGATEWDEIAEAVEIVKQMGNKNLTLLVCTSSYPADPKDANLLRMKTLRDAFEVNVGLSDHTLGIGTSIAAIALGATVIEKHLTVRRSDGGADGAFSMEPHEFAQLVQEGIFANSALGESQWRLANSEEESRRLRRTLYVVKDVVAGQTITNENVRAIRPGQGCLPKLKGEFLGKKFASNATSGTPMSIDLVDYDS
jgi:pseudaminic acid synthase